MARIRLDQHLVGMGLAASRSKAQGLIMAGEVLVNGQRADKAGMAVKPGAKVEIKSGGRRFVSRGGEKLASAVDGFELDVSGLRCLDVGASTGGFTDCLLKAGAARVTALDVGYGQMAWELRGDERVEVIERTNARNMGDQVAPGPFGLISVDVSFISLTLVLPNLVGRLGAGGLLLCLVKPQFEAGIKQVGKGGVVRDDSVRAACVDKVAACVKDLRLKVLGSRDSGLAGPKGNREIFLLAQRPIGPAWETSNLEE